MNGASQRVDSGGSLGSWTLVVYMESVIENTLSFRSLSDDDIPATWPLSCGMGVLSCTSLRCKQGRQATASFSFQRPGPSLATGAGTSRKVRPSDGPARFSPVFPVRRRTCADSSMKACRGVGASMIFISPRPWDSRSTGCRSLRIVSMGRLRCGSRTDVHCIVVPRVIVVRRS